jgi:hypothetical protein
MKKYFLVTLLSCLFYSEGQTKEKILRNFRFVEASSFKEKNGLPPKLEITFDFFCNEEFLQVIRYEKIDPKTNKITIAVGALVQENALSSCAGKKRKLVVDAGTTFSGRDYEITRIKK